MADELYMKQETKGLSKENILTSHRSTQPVKIQQSALVGEREYRADLSAACANWAPYSHAVDQMSHSQTAQGD